MSAGFALAAGLRESRKYHLRSRKKINPLRECRAIFTGEDPVHNNVVVRTVSCDENDIKSLQFYPEYFHLNKVGTIFPCYGTLFVKKREKKYGLLVKTGPQKQ